MITIDWLTKIITVPQSFLTWQGGNAYTLDVNAFRLALKDLEDDEVGMPFPDTHRHTTNPVLSGVTYPRTFEIINGYTVTFQNTGTHYQVTCVGANHNIADIFIPGPVNLVIGNSAGLITVTSGSGVTAQDKLDIAAAVLNAALVSPIWSNVKQVNSTTVIGTGATGNEWGPA